MSKVCIQESPSVPKQSQIQEKTYVKNLSFGQLKAQVSHAGEDLHILLTGGTRPHIGCTVLAIPRPSLTGDGSISVTSSVLNVTGHKDEVICRRLAERVAAQQNVTVVCTGGFHVDGITEAQIREVWEALETVFGMLHLLKNCFLNIPVPSHTSHRS